MKTPRTVAPLRTLAAGAALLGAVCTPISSATASPRGPIVVTAPSDPGPASTNAPAVQPHEWAIRHWVARLGLDAKQHDELKAVVTEFHDAVAPVFKDRHDAEVAIRDAVLAGKTEEEIAALHDQLAADERKLSVAQTTAYRKALAILTADQLKHAAGLFSLFAVGL